MRLSLTLVDGRNERAVDTVVDFDPDQPVADLVRPLVGVLGETMHDSFARRIPVWVDGAEVDPLAPAGKSGIRSGAVVSLFEPADRVVRAAPSGVAELRVVAGPGAGRIHRLPLGETVVGCGAPGWSLPDLRLPADGLRVTVTPDGSVRVVPAPGLDTRLDSRALGEQTETEPVPAGAVAGDDGGAAWPVGGYLAAGDTVLVRAEVGEPTADVSVNHDEALVELNRPPRLLPPDRERSFHLPDRPAPRKGRPLPWVMVVAPLVISVPMAFISPRFLLFALFSPLMAIANFLSDRRGSRKENIAANLAYEQTLAAVDARIEQALVAEQQERRLTSPDPATLLMAAIGPGPRLWERRPSDPDYLRLRVGLATLPATVRVEQRRDKTDEPAPPRTLDHVPAWMDLSQLGVIGVAGDEDTARPLARWLVAQAALLHSPRDVRVVVLSDAAGEPDWDWVRWLPHARPEGDVNPLLGTQQESVGRRLAELSAVVEAREQAATDRVRPTPDVLVVLDGARRLRALPAVVDLLRRGPAVGVHVVCVDRRGAAAPRGVPGRGRLRARHRPDLRDRLRRHRRDRPRPGRGALVRDRRARGLRAARHHPAGRGRGHPRARPGCWSRSTSTRRPRRPWRCAGSTAGRPTWSSASGTTDRSHLDLRQGRPARAGRRHHRLRQVGVAADPGGLAGGRQPPGRS